MSFDRLAPHYRWMEAVLAGEKLQRCRARFLERVDGSARICIGGEGHGRFLVACRRRLPDARITCLDASQAMLIRAARRLRAAGLPSTNTEFIQADLQRWKGPTGQFDLIATHFFLDCFAAAELAAVIRNLAAAAAPASAWLISDFRVPAAGPARWRALILHRLMYWFFRGVTGISARARIEPGPWLEAEGFRRVESRHSEWGLLTSELWRRG